MGVPSDGSLDATLALLREGYLFVPRRRARLSSDIFLTRLLLERVVVISGTEAAQRFYDPALFRRRDAMPGRIRKTLVGSDGVQELDGEVHARRKAMFMALMTRQNLARLMDMVDGEWQQAIMKWQVAKKRICLFNEMTELLCRAACRWAGVPVGEDEAVARGRDLHDMVSAFGRIGLPYWRGKIARNRSEEWAASVIIGARQKPDGSPMKAAHVIAHHEDASGHVLPPLVAAVELLNVLRPIVAIATYIAFAAHALGTWPAYRQRLRDAAGAGALSDAFAQEVRRYYPFAPFVGARVERPFSWAGHDFPEGQLVILDIYGMNHDPRLWDEPETFRPERFAGFSDDGFTFMPQGGGEHFHTHRCAGEWLTIEIIRRAAVQLAALDYDLPAQDLTIDLGKVPTRPASGVLISRVTRVADVPALGLERGL